MLIAINGAGELKPKVTEALYETYGIDTRPIRVGKAGNHLLATFSTRKEACDAVQKAFSVAIDQARNQEYVTALPAPNVSIPLRNKRDETMRTMMMLLKYHRHLLAEESMRGLIRLSIEKCAASKEILVD